GGVLVAGAVDHRDRVIELLARAQVAAQVNAPVGGAAVAETVDQHFFHVTETVVVLGQADPRRAGRTDAQDCRVGKTPLDVGLLDVQIGFAVVAHVVEIGGQVQRPHRVELVSDGEIKALGVEARARRIGVAGVAVALVDVGQVDVHLAADGGVAGRGLGGDGGQAERGGGGGGREFAAHG